MVQKIIDGSKNNRLFKKNRRFQIMGVSKNNRWFKEKTATKKIDGSKKIDDSKKIGGSKNKWFKKIETNHRF
jgi:hypothetical protein